MAIACLGRDERVEPTLQRHEHHGAGIRLADSGRHRSTGRGLIQVPGVEFVGAKYRDSHGALLYTELIRQFGEDLVFLDCESIPAGADFATELLDRVRSARVLLAVIGPRWLTTADPTGRRRINDSDDWIRRELVEAFAAGVTVIPVLTGETDLPKEVDLPADIAALSSRQYRRLRRREPTADLRRIVTDLTTLDPTLAAAHDRNSTSRQPPGIMQNITASSPNSIAQGVINGSIYNHDVTGTRIRDRASSCPRRRSRSPPRMGRDKANTRVRHGIPRHGRQQATRVGRGPRPARDSRRLWHQFLVHEHDHLDHIAGRGEQLIRALLPHYCPELY